MNIAYREKCIAFAASILPRLRSTWKRVRELSSVTFSSFRLAGVDEIEKGRISSGNCFDRHRTIGFSCRPGDFDRSLAIPESFRRSSNPISMVSSSRRLYRIEIREKFHVSNKSLVIV